MRKLSLPITTFALGAMLISACTGPTTGPGPNNGAGPGFDVTNTPFQAETVPPIGADATPFQSEATPVTVTEAVPVTGDATATQPVMVDATSTPSTGDTSGATATPGTGAAGSLTVTAPPVTSGDVIQTPGATDVVVPTLPATGAGIVSTPRAVGGMMETFVRLSDILQMGVAASDQPMVGSVTGVVVDRPDVSATTANGTNVAASTPVVRYLVVARQAGSETGEVLVPWQAFNFEQASVDTSSNVLNMTSLNLNMGSAAISGAPAFDRSIAGDFSGDWDAPLSGYWANQGLSIPATGAGSATGSTSENRGHVLLDVQQMNQFNVTGADNQMLGNVADFLIDSQTGEVAFAILNGGASLNNRSFVVPLSNLNWQFDTTGLSGLMANFPNTIFDLAPFIDMAGGTFELPQDWSNQIEDFWNTIPNITTP